MLISNKPIKVAHLHKLVNQSMVNGGVLVIEMVTILLVKARKTWSFDGVRNVLTEKKMKEKTLVV